MSSFGEVPFVIHSRVSLRRAFFMRPTLKFDIERNWGERGVLGAAANWLHNAERVKVSQAVSEESMLAKEMKSGAVITYEESPVIIESVSVQSPSARGATTLYKFRGRNLITKQKVDFVLKGTDHYPEADFEKRSVKLMYQDANEVHFLDEVDFNQHTLLLDDISEQMDFITAELEGLVGLIYQGECVGLQLPVAVELTITQTDPAVKGNSATARTKPATLETGVQIQVPEYIKEGERIRVDTRTREFLSRA